MKKKLLILLNLLFFSTAVFAYELTGTLHDNGNGTYDVFLKNEDGDVFTGVGVYQGGGAIKIIARGLNGVTYAGMATDYGSGEYQIDLKNVATGILASGILDVEAPQ